MNRPLTAEYIVELFEGVKDCQSNSDWEHNKKRFIELIKEYGTEQCNIANVVGRSEQFVCKECGHNKKAVNTTLKKICCAKCRSFAN